MPRLLDPDNAWEAQKELSIIGAAAVPSLAAATSDTRFLDAKWPMFAHLAAPLDAVLQLLALQGANHLLAAAVPLVDSPFEEARKIAAVRLASSARVEAIPAITRLLNDADRFVRQGIGSGLAQAISEGDITEYFRWRAYDLVLAQCDQPWAIPFNDARRRSRGP